MKLYDYPLSGNGYKVRLLLAHLGLPYDYVPVDILAGQARAEWFLKKNPLGKVPVLELDDGRSLPESNAILLWLARGSAYWPDDPFQQAQAASWLFFEQRSHMPNLGGARYWLTLQKSPLGPSQRALVEELQAKGREALAVMEGHLARHAFLVGERYSIADMALYAYTHLAHEAGIELAPFPAIGGWLGRVRGQPGYVGIDARTAR